MVVDVAGLRMIHAAVVHQEAHREEVLVSRRGLGGWWLVACIGPLHWLVQPQSLLLKAQLGNALLGA